MEDYYKNLLKYIGEDTDREGLRDTPKRAARAFEYLTKGYKDNLDKIINNAVFESDNDEMIIVKDIELYSLCEHHLLPFFGKCHVGYLPNKKILGLSKLARIVDVFARRLQVQENLTKQIAETILKYTDAKGVGVVIEAQHCLETGRTRVHRCHPLQPFTDRGLESGQNDPRPEGPLRDFSRRPF